MPSKRFAVSSKSSEYERVRNKLMAQVTWYKSSELQKYVEKLKLWDAVHGFTMWDKL